MVADRLYNFQNFGLPACRIGLLRTPEKTSKNIQKRQNPACGDLLVRKPGEEETPDNVKHIFHKRSRIDYTISQEKNRLDILETGHHGEANQPKFALPTTHD